MAADAKLAEALIRIEHKQDILLRWLNLPRDQMPQLQFSDAGISCPLCMMPISYTVDLQDLVAVRNCGCKTGKVPPAQPLFPVVPEENQNEGRYQHVTSGSDAAESPDRDRNRR